MIYFAGFLFIILSCTYTMSFAKYSWTNNNKLAAIGAVLIIFISFGVCLWAYLRT